MSCSDEAIIEFYKYINKEENKNQAYSKGILKSLVEEIIRLRNLEYYINKEEEEWKPCLKIL
jgi:hypothetical protein